MAELATMARPYANAVFGIADGEGRLPEWSRMLAFLSAASEAPEVSEILRSPSIASVVKADRLASLVSDELTDSARRFVHVLAENKRLELLGVITEQYEALRAEREKVMDVSITTAIELADERLSSLTDALKKRFDQEINVTTEVDASIIGGAVIRAGDTVIDGSVRGKLAKLQESLGRV